jgi:hypothetical protein
MILFNFRMMNLLMNLDLVQKKKRMMKYQGNLKMLAIWTKDCLNIWMLI